MPDLKQLDLDLNPSEDPGHYPGRLVTESCVVAQSWLYRVVPQHGVHLGRWLTKLDGGPLGMSDGGAASRLDDVLQAAGVAVMDDRSPVLAIGSNAAPGQLRHKFGASPDVSSLVPMTRARVNGIGVGYSAHVSKAGYIPYAPVVASPKLVREYFILWLDGRQVERINETEPNYHPTVVRGDAFPVLLETGESLKLFTLYGGRWGVIRMPDSDHPLPAGTQQSVYEALAALAWFRELVPEVQLGFNAAISALGADEERRTVIREEMARQHLGTDDMLPQAEGENLTYLNTRTAITATGADS